jgi:hypothetical protein
MSNHLNQILDGIEQGLVSQEELESLQKAITAGYGGAGKPTDLTYGGVIQSESLESTLKSVTFDMKNLKFWPAVSIDKAYNLFERKKDSFLWNTKESISSNDFGSHNCWRCSCPTGQRRYNASSQAC